MADDHYQSLPDGGFPANWKYALTVKFTPTAADHFRANWSMLHRGRVMWVAYVFFGILPLLVVGVSYLAGIPDDMPFSPLLVLAGPVLIFIVLPLLLWSGSRMGLKRFPSALREQIYTIDNDGVTISNELARTEMKWRTFARVVETKDAFLFYYAEGAGYFMPKRALPDPEVRHELRQILRAHLGDKAQLRSMSD